MDDDAVREALRAAAAPFQTAPPPAVRWSTDRSSRRWHPMGRPTTRSRSSSSTKATSRTTVARACWPPTRPRSTRLLAGDHFDASGLRLVARRGDLDAVRLLTRLMASCSWLRAEQQPLAFDDDLWALCVAGIAATCAGGNALAAVRGFDEVAGLFVRGRVERLPGVVRRAAGVWLAARGRSWRPGSCARARRPGSDGDDPAAPAPSGRGCPMSLREFIETLRREGELATVAAPVDPCLEMAEIADRASKAGGPALLFERPAAAAGSRALRERPSLHRRAVPVLMNQFGSYRRLELALGAPLDELAGRIAELVELQVPKGLVGKVKALGQLRELASFAPEDRLQGGVSRGRRRSSRPGPAAGAHHLAGRRRAVHHPARLRHQGPRGAAQRRHVPPAGLRRPHDRHALARAPRRRRQLPRGRRTPRGRRRAGHRPGGHLRGHGAAAGGHRRVHVRRLPAGPAGRARGLRHGRPRGAGRRGDRARGLRRQGRDAARRARSATTPATTRWPTTTPSFT